MRSSTSDDLLADENVQRTVVESPWQRGYAVRHMQEMAPGVPDDIVLDYDLRECA